MKRIVFLLTILIGFIACDDIVEGDDISSERVSLLAPGKDAVLEITTPVFSWGVIQDAEYYHLQIATPSFNEALQIVADTTVTATNFSTTLEANAYEWRVKASNLGSDTAYSTQSFVINGPADISDEQVTVLAPSNGAVLNPGSSTFSWEALEDAEHYQVQIAVPSFAEAVEIVTDTTVTTTNFSTTLEVNTYEWRIKAKNSNSETAYSTQNFSVEE